MQTSVALICLVLVMVGSHAATASAADKDHPHDFDPSQYAGRAAWEARADVLRRQALVAQGLWPMPARTPLEPVIHGTIDRDGYTVEKVYFASLPGHYVTGNLYRPKGRQGKLPVVLAPYGHWPGGRFIWRDDAGVNKDLDSGAEKDPIAARTPLQANCAQLARMGCIVFHYDMVGYGDSTAIPHREGFTDAEAVMRLQSTMGLQTWNSIRALDFILGLPQADPSRVAVVGSSGGGTQAIALTAVDKDRVAVAFPMVMVSMNMQGGCVCENAPLWRVGTNNVELASLFAPKPQGMAAANDWTHDFLQRGLPEMKTVWGFYGAAEDVRGEHFPYPHNHNLHSRLAQYRFLNEHLKLGQSEPIEEQPFEPVPPEQLGVYDAEHPRPADEADASGVRRWMTKTSDDQLAKLSDEEYVRTVRDALRAMVVDDDQGRDPSHTSLASTMPPDWNGHVLIWANPGALKAAGNVPAGYAAYAPRSLATATAPDAAPATSRADTKPRDPKYAYAGFTLGYNRSALGQDVLDLLDLIARVRRDHPEAKSVNLIATGDAAPAALLARALAGDAIDRAAIDLIGFDFDRVNSDDYPMLLPGALKYGGIYGFIPLLEAGQTLIVNARQTGKIALARKTPNVTIETEPRDVPAMIKWLIERK